MLLSAGHRKFESEDRSGAMNGAGSRGSWRVAKPGLVGSAASTGWRPLLAMQARARNTVPRDYNAVSRDCESESSN